MESDRESRSWLPVAIVVLGLALTVLLAVMRGPAYLGLAVIGVGAVAQFVSSRNSAS